MAKKKYETQVIKQICPSCSGKQFLKHRFIRSLDRPGHHPSVGFYVKVEWHSAHCKKCRQRVNIRTFFTEPKASVDLPDDNKKPSPSRAKKKTRKRKGQVSRNFTATAV